MSCRLISSDEGKQDNGAGFASPSYLIRVRAWAFYLDAILVSLIVSASRVVGRLASCRRDVSCVSSDEGQASKEAGRVIILGPVSSASATSSVRAGVPSPGSRAVIASSPHPRQASRRRRGGLDDRIPAGIGKREQASKTRTTDGLAPIPIITRSNGLPIPCHIASIAPPHDKHTTRRTTRRRNDERRRANETNMGTTRTTDGRRGE